jgi:hypothetical protein
MVSDSLLVKCHCLFLLRTKCICNAKMKCTSTSETLTPGNIRVTWLGKRGGTISLGSSNSGYKWDLAPQLLSWDMERVREETKTSKCISICKVPDLSCRWEKKTKIPYDFTSRDSFLFCLRISSKKNLPIPHFLLIRGRLLFSTNSHITFMNEVCPCNFQNCFCMKIPKEKIYITSFEVTEYLNV